METELYFDYLPEELIMIILEFLGPNSKVFNDLNEYKDLYNKFIDKIKRGMVLPDYLFNSTNDFIDSIVETYDFYSTLSTCSGVDILFNIDNDSGSINYKKVQRYFNIIRIYWHEEEEYSDGVEYKYIFQSTDLKYIYFELITYVRKGIEIKILSSYNWCEFFTNVLPKELKNKLLKKNECIN